MVLKKKKHRVVCFGSAVADVFLSSGEFKLLKTSQAGVEKTAICSLYGDKVEISGRVITSGGGGTNAAVGFARLGLKTAVAARMGQDPLGKMIVDELKREDNLDLGWLAAKRGEETDMSVILLGLGGGRSILVYRGKTRLTQADIPWARLKADWFYIASLEGNLQLVSRLLDFARKNNIKVAWNPGKKELAQRSEVLSLLARADVVLLNKEEARSLLQADSSDFWRKVGQIAAPITVITRGRQGVTVLAGGKRFHRSIFAVTVADETGAGDGFGCGFTAGLIKDFGIEKSIDWGLANAASVVSHIGAKAGLLVPAQIKNFISR